MKTLFAMVAFVAMALGLIAAPTLTLTWADNSTDEDGFRIERKVGAGAWTTLTTLPVNSVTYDDVGPFAKDTTYTYRVLAFNEWGESGWSNEAAVYTATPQAPGAIKVTVQVQVTVLRADYPLLAAVLKE
jgi:titin